MITSWNFDSNFFLQFLLVKGMQALNPVKRVGKTLGTFLCQSGYQKTVIPLAGSNVSLHGDLCSFFGQSD